MQRLFNPPPCASTGKRGGTVSYLTRRRWQPLWTESVLYIFTGGTDGREPYARLRFDAAGNLYGTTLLKGQAIVGRSSVGRSLKRIENALGSIRWILASA